MAIPVTSGLVLQLESSLMVGFSAGDKVGQWDDASGNGYNATASGVNRPTYQVNSRSGPCVRFAGDPEYLTLGNPFSITSTVTMFAVFSMTVNGSSNRQTIFGQRNTALALSMEGGGTVTDTLQPNRGVITTGVNVSYGTSGNSANNVTETFVYRKTGAGAGTHTLRVNGRALIDEADSAGAITGNGTKDIGRRNTSSQHFVGDLYAFIIFNRALTDQEISDVEEYLMTQYQADQYEVNLQGTGTTTASGLKQAVAWDGSHYYESTTQFGGGRGYLSKFTRPVSSDTYTEILEREVTSDWTGSAAGCMQANGMNYYNGYLWVGGNNYPGTTPEEGYIFQYDPATLTLVNKWVTSTAKWCEGGAWYDVGDGNGVCFWTVYHDSLVTEQYNSSMVLLNTYTKPNPPHQYTNDHLHQSATWFTDPVSGYKFFILPCHESSGVSAVDIYRWNGTGFDMWQRMEQPAPLGQQGNHWGRLAGATPNIGDEMMFARRDPGEGLQRTTFARRGLSAAPVITVQPVGATKTEGESVTFSVTATGVPDPTYQWRKDGGNIGGATSSTYNIPSVALGDAGDYDVVVTNTWGSETSDIAALIVNAAGTAPTITTEPSDASYTAGDTFHLTVVATGDPTLTYQWRKGGVNISGEVDSTLYFAPASLSDAGSYDVVVTNPYGSDTSVSVTVTVAAPVPTTGSPLANGSGEAGSPAAGASLMGEMPSQAFAPLTGASPGQGFAPLSGAPTPLTFAPLTR